MASVDRLGITPPSFTTILSVASFPSGTSSAGILGMLHSNVANSFSASSICNCNSLSFSLYPDTFSFTAFASSALPSFISIPICFDSRLTSCLFLSNFCCASRLRLSVSRTFFIASSAPLKCFFSNPLITRSVSSPMSLSVSIRYLFTVL